MDLSPYILKKQNKTTKQIFPLQQGKGMNLSRAFMVLIRLIFFFEPSLFHKIGMEISTGPNLPAFLKH